MTSDINRERDALKQERDELRRQLERLQGQHGAAPDVASLPALEKLRVGRQANHAEWRRKKGKPG